MQREPWLQLRQRLGDAQDRVGLLQLLCNASDYRPMPHQVRAHIAHGSHADTQQKLFLAGIGAGKTVWSMAEAVLLALANPGCIGAVTAPTYDQVVNVLLPEFTAITDALAAHGYPLVRKYVRSMAEAHLVCGGRILFRSFSKVDHLRGFSLAWAAMDESEVARNPEYIWDVLVGRLRSPKARMRQIHCTTTPQGLRGVPALFVEGRRRADSVEDPAERAEALRRFWACRTSTHLNVHLPKGYIESLTETYSKRQYEQEIEARILKPSTAVWPEFTKEDHTRPWAFDPSLPYSISCDWGHQYPYVLWVQQAPDGAWIVFDEYCEDQIPRDHLRHQIQSRCKKLGRDPEHAVGDRAVREEMSWLSGAFPKTWTHRMRTRQEQSIMHGVEAVRSLLDPLRGAPMLYLTPKLSASQQRRSLVNCLVNYRFKMRSDGGINPSEPLKDNVHDHGSDALRMFVVAVALGKERFYTLGKGNDRRPDWSKGDGVRVHGRRRGGR